MGTHHPSCSQCGTQMLLVRILPDGPGNEQRTYKCSWCPHQMTEVGCVNELATRIVAKQHFENCGKRKRD
jgi:hypothetical protein